MKSNFKHKGTHYGVRLTNSEDQRDICLYDITSGAVKYKLTIAHEVTRDAARAKINLGDNELVKSCIADFQRIVNEM